MIILSLDQSTKATGVSVFRNKQLDSYDVLQVENADNLQPLQRIREMYFMIRDYVDKIKPDFIAIEEIQFQQNYGTYQQLAQMQGAILAVVYELDIPCAFCPSTKWKAFNKVVGKKREQQKLSAIQKVKEFFGIDVVSDIADSILQGWYFCAKLKGDEF